MTHPQEKTLTVTTPGPAVPLIERAADIVVAEMRKPHTAPYHWVGALWEAGMLCAPGTATFLVDPPAARPAPRRRRPWWLRWLPR